ncbi:MAG: DNA polymerase III subunit gamma/tau [Chthoniobacterales bacterium]
MSYRVFARKYRPQRFEEVVGQEHITQTLQNAITTGRLAQAYLFVGPRGVGKTSTARIFAKALNCHQGPTIHPCGVCDACVDIAEGNSLDVLEIDGASNNSVESIRTLRENSAFAPARGPYKIYLIDEVHMLTTAAFNALLKTLEEPPEHVKFLFATTEAQKLPATITSRCQRFDLRRLSEKLIAKHLLHIAEKETIKLSNEAAAALARGADGALRDAESMFDQIISFCGTTIQEDDVQTVFGFTPSEVVSQLATALLTQDVAGGLALISKQAHAGKDLTRLLGDLIGFLRDLLIFKVHPTEATQAKAALSETVSSEKLLVLLEDLGEAEGRLRWATDKKLQLDIAIIKAAHLLQEVSLSDVLNVLSNLRDDAATSSADSAAKLQSAPALHQAKLKVEAGVRKKTEKSKVDTTIEDFHDPKKTLSPDPVKTASEKDFSAPTAPEPTPAAPYPEVEQLTLEVEEQKKTEKSNVATSTGHLNYSEPIAAPQQLTLEVEEQKKTEKSNVATSTGHLNYSEPIAAPQQLTLEVEEQKKTEESKVDTLAGHLNYSEAVLESTPAQATKPHVQENHWDEVATALATESRLKFGWVTLGKFLERNGNKMIVEFPSSCEAQTETLFWPQARKKIQECLSKNLGIKMELVCQFTGVEPPEEIFDEPTFDEPLIFEKSKKKSPSPAKAKEIPPVSTVPPKLTPEALENFKNDPLIQKALEIFRAEVITR